MKGVSIRIGRTLALSLALATAFFAVSVFTSCPSAPAPVPPPVEMPPPPPAEVHEFERAVFDLVNRERANHGLSPLVWHESLASVARMHNADMHRNNFMSLTGSDGSTARERITRGSITNVRSSGSLVSAGLPTPQAVMENWMNLPGNRAIILTPESTHIGAGFLERPEGSSADFSTYWTVKFIRWYPPLTQAQIRELEMRVLELTNRERASHGLRPLIWHETLAYAAREHSADMYRNNFMGHTGSDGSTVAQRVERAGIANWRSISENVARGQNTPETVVAAWMNSPGHRANILYENSTHLGVGLVEWSEGSTADLPTSWTQKFASFRD
ncbi:MAG: CAP domain-containing protein [Treponema sp.]|nr:CAP domain-containing protein [Treponema sp.]